ncbi:hypothetical protein [Nitrosopumilus sp. S4]
MNTTSFKINVTANDCIDFKNSSLVNIATNENKINFIGGMND